MSVQIEKRQMGDLPVLAVESEHAAAVVSPWGAHVLSFRPFDTDCEEDVLFVSEKSALEPGKAVRGGIPVCWPWFGKAGTPNHGIARICRWETNEPTEEPDGSLTLHFFLDAAAGHGLQASAAINIGRALTFQLITKNVSAQSVRFTDALHTYFRVGDIERVKVEGLADCPYFCKVTDRQLRQEGVIHFTGETDRIYEAGSRIAVIDDPVLDRKIRVERFNSESAVVWNPWIEKAASMADFDDAEYRRMLCIEAANAGNDSRIVAPGGIHTLGTRISLLND